MDILYLVGDKTTSNFEDVRMSLRSIDMYGENIDRVFMCGFIPDFVSENVIKIPFEILPSKDIFDKARNIYKQIIYAIENSDIGMNHDGEFLVSMDDHYITKPTDFSEKYPFYVKDYIKRKCRYKLPEVFEPGFGSGLYQSFLVKCCEYLKKQKLPFYNFCPHRNMHMNRYLIEELNEINDDIFKNKQPVEAFCLVNNYRLSKNSLLKYDICHDIKSDNPVKLNNHINNGCNFFSTNDFRLGSSIHKLLLYFFPNKSKYEN